MGRLLTADGVQWHELVRFVAVSQPQAGAFLNAVPKFEAFRIQTWAMRIAVQKRLGLASTTRTASLRASHPSPTCSTTNLPFCVSNEVSASGESSVSVELVRLHGGKASGRYKYGIQP